MSGYDIYFQPVPAESVRGFKCFEFGYAAALKVKGPHALVNRWVKTLMTPIGSDPLYPAEGTTFGGLVGSNIGGVSVNLQDLVAIAFQEASDQVREQDLEGYFPDDERLQSAELMDFEEAADGFVVWVLIKNVAGDALQVPLTTLQTR
jgi:hypothetical protein